MKYLVLLVLVGALYASNLVVDITLGKLWTHVDYLIYLEIVSCGFMVTVMALGVAKMKAVHDRCIIGSMLVVHLVVMGLQAGWVVQMVSSWNPLWAIKIASVGCLMVPVVVLAVFIRREKVQYEEV